MILFLDSSALVKRYVEEEGTKLVDELWEKAEEVATSVVAFAEVISAFSRKSREGILTQKELIEIIYEFKEDYSRMIHVPITLELNKIIERLLVSYSLKGFDAIHLASALILKVEFPETVFLCFDKALNKTARKENLKLP